MARGRAEQISKDAVERTGHGGHIPVRVALLGVAARRLAGARPAVRRARFLEYHVHCVVPQWEPIAALAAVAGVTERIRVGTLVVDNGLRNPVLTAKAAATIDRLSGGRFELGLGAGYVAANFRAAGVSFARASQRLDQLEESIELMRRLWRTRQPHSPVASTR